MNTVQFLMAIVNWLQADPSHVMVAASAIAMVTPTPDPKTPFGKIYKLVELLALNVLHAKESGVTAEGLAVQVAALLAQKQTQPAVPAAPAVPAVPAVAPANQGIQGVQS